MAPIGPRLPAGEEWRGRPALSATVRLFDVAFFRKVITRHDTGGGPVPRTPPCCARRATWLRAAARRAPRGHAAPAWHPGCDGARRSQAPAPSAKASRLPACCPPRPRFNVHHASWPHPTPPRPIPTLHIPTFAPPPPPPPRPGRGLHGWRLRGGRPGGPAGGGHSQRQQHRGARRQYTLDNSHSKVLTTLFSSLLYGVWARGG